jgi:O-succinylbenzoic acid--CoA ligase
VVAEGRTLTYAELHRRADQLARRLAVTPGARVPTTLPPGLSFCELLHALPRLGGVLVPLDPDGPAAPQPPLGPAQDRSLLDEIDPGAVHTVIHTSGTTGEPRAVELTYANHLASAIASADALGVEADDRWLCPLPLHHVAGLNVLIRSAINRTTAVLHPRFEVERVRAALEEGELTLASLVPTMLQRLRDAGLRRVPRLRAIALGGGPIPPGLLEWAADSGIPVVPVYGMTETCSQVVAGSPGRPLRGVELRLADDGEILIRGPMVAPQSLGEDGWLHTGDLGRLDREGLLHVQGRTKELIVTGGENVAPLEVERVLASHPRVMEAAVAGVPDPEWGEAIVAFVVLRSAVAPGELRAWCRERLTPFKVPKSFRTVTELPRNQTGKLMRDRLDSLASAPP